MSKQMLAKTEMTDFGAMTATVREQADELFRSAISDPPPPDVPIEEHEEPRRPPRRLMSRRRRPETDIGIANAQQWDVAVAIGSTVTGFKLIGTWDQATGLFHGKIAVFTKARRGRPNKEQAAAKEGSTDG